MFDDGQDIKQLLIDRGLSKLDALYVDMSVSGMERVYLKNALLADNTESNDTIRAILSKFNICFEQDYKNLRLNNGRYNVIVTIPDFDKCEDFLYFLDDKAIPFVQDGDTFFIKCPDDHTSVIIDDYVSILNNNKIKENKMNKNKRSISDITNKTMSTKNIIKESKNSLSETKLGFSGISNLGVKQTNLFDINRLAELAGINEDFGIDDIDTTGVDDISVDAPIDDEFSIDTTDGMETGDISDVDIDSSVTTVPVSNSDAMSSILDNLNSIQLQLPDIRLSEYKSLMIKVDELNAQLKTMGASYLGERRLRK